MSRAGWYAETERLLSQYWHRCLRGEILKAKIQTLREELRQLEEELVEGRRIPGLVARYGVTGGTSGSRGDYSDLMESYDKMARGILVRMMGARKQLLRMQERLARLEAENAAIEAAVRRLSLTEQNILEQRYIYRRSNYDIAAMLHCNEKTVRRWRDAAIARVAVWLGKVARNEDCG